MSTLKELRDEVKSDLDLEDSTFGEDVTISDADINRWINLGIKKAERIIMGLYEDYFLSFTSIAIVSNVNKYSFPTDIYANKIRKIIFDNGSTSNVHEVKRIKSLSEATEYDLMTTSVSDPLLRWYPVNSLSAGRKIQIFPKYSRNGTLSVWYIRNAKQLATDNDVTDIDEFSEYITTYAKMKAAVKDNDPRAKDFQEDLAELEIEMQSTLSAMVPDENDEMPIDTCFYEESN